MTFICKLIFAQEGRYEYKYIVDDEWLCNKDELLTSANNDGHVNNYVEVRLFPSIETLLCLDPWLT